MTTTQDIYCSKCSCKTDQALMLSCDHNLCMNCAAKYLNQNSNQFSNPDNQNIICELCGSKTEIDSQTAQEILSTVFKNLNLNFDLLSSNNNKYNNFNKTENLNNENQNYLNNEIFLNSMDNINNINNLLISNSNIINRKNLCPEHNEPLTYLCLDCMTKCICSECIVHGVHQHHDVLNIKKAYPLIYNKVKDLFVTLNEKINDLNNSKRNIERKKRSIEALNVKCKNDIKNAFNIIRLRLNEKEREIMEKTEMNLNDNLNELKTYEHVIQGKIINLNKIIDSLNANIMRKDELNLINYYCDNKNNVLLQINNAENNNVFNINTVSDLKINIDKSSFDNMLISLNNLDFEINSFKGIDINNSFDTGKYIAQRNLYGADFKKIKNELNLKLPLSNNKNEIFKFDENRKIYTENPRLNRGKNINKGNKKRINSTTKGKKYK